MGYCKNTTEESIVQDITIQLYQAYNTNKKTNRAVLPFIFTWLNFLIWAGSSFIFCPNCCPTRCHCLSCFPSIYHLHFHRKYLHQTHAIQLVITLSLNYENIAVAIFKFPQMKSTNNVCLKMPKNSVYKLRSLLKWGSGIVFSQATLWVGSVAKQLIIYSRWWPSSKSHKFVRFSLKGLSIIPKQARFKYNNYFSF